MPNVLNLRKFLLLAGDVFLLYFALLGALFFGFWGNFSWEIFLEHLFPFSILYFFWLIIFYIFGLYDLDLLKTPFSFYTRALSGLGLCLGLGMIFFYLIPFFGITPKTNLILNILIFGIFALSWRQLFYQIFASRFLTKVGIVGENIQAQELAGYIQKNPHLGYKLTTFLDVKKNLLQQIQEQNIDILIIAANLGSNSQLAQNLYQCVPARINFMDLSRAYEIICDKIPISFVAQTWFLENLKEGEKGFYDKAKRIIDILLAFLLLLLTSPLWLLVALAIKLEDRGPIFYYQERTGEDRKPFLLIKFRSMIKDAEKEKAIWAEKEDPRITKVGKFLRQSHLDEIPQMLNVLKGDISLVGPRPERPEFVGQLEKEIPHYHIRHLIKPGFTGWAQIKFKYGRSVMDSFEKFQYDLYYLKNRSLILDLRILLKTFSLLFRKE